MPFTPFSPPMPPQFKFKPHILDTSLPEGLYAQTALAELEP